MWDFLKTFFPRFLDSPKTTMAGHGIGAGLAAIGYTILEQAGCNLSNIQWSTIIAMLYAGPAAVGSAATDNGKIVTP